MIGLSQREGYQARRSLSRAPALENNADIYSILTRSEMKLYTGVDGWDKECYDSERENIE